MNLLYAADGSLIKDDNKGTPARSRIIPWKTSTSYFTDVGERRPPGDATGTKLKVATMKVCDHSTTDYVRVYTNNALGFLQFTGRPVVKKRKQL